MTIARSLPPPRILFAVALWVLALIPFALVLRGLSDPQEAVSWTRGITEVSQYALGTAAIAALVALVLYPPALATLRLALHRSKARMSIDQGPAAQALQRLEHLPTSRDHLIVGTWFLDTGDLAQAASHLIEAVNLEPSSIPAHYALAEAAYRSGNTEVALAEYAGVVEREPDHAYGRALLGLAKALESSGKGEEALKAYEKHERMHGEQRATLMARAHLLHKRDEKTDTTDLLKRAAAPAKNKLSPEEAYWQAKAKAALRFGGIR